MTHEDRAINPNRARTGYAILATLLPTLAAIATLFLIGMANAARYFDRAAYSQGQLATVSRIETSVLDPSGDRRALASLLAGYRASIAQERRLDGGSAMVDETRDAATLSRLAETDTPEAHAALRAIVTRIVERERGEAQATAAAMRALRARTSLLALILAMIAGALAAIGAVLMLTANRRLEAQVAARTGDLVASNARLAEVDRSRRLFFAKASHELRTPVTVMRGEAEVALADPAGGVPMLRESLGQVVVQSELLSRRIEELLGLARAEDGTIEMENRPLDAAAIARTAVAAALAHARSADVVLALETANHPLTISGDARWLGQALLAILDNGVKFSGPNGTLRIRADRAEDHARIAISDAGTGVVVAELPRIFDAYYQADSGRMRGGSGLGLALARWVVERHGGTIAAANRVPAGCAITILLPLTS